jgi:hypothetical protein
MLILILLRRKRGKKSSSRGSAIAISERKALTCLHQQVDAGLAISIVTRRGEHKQGKNIFSSFIPDREDIAAIELDEGPSFSKFVPLSRTPVSLASQIQIVGLKIFHG